MIEMMNSITEAQRSSQVNNLDTKRVEKWARIQDRKFVEKSKPENSGRRNSIKISPWLRMAGLLALHLLSN